MKRWIAVLILAGLSGFAAEAAAQGGLSSLDVRVTPRVGVLTPADYFYEEFVHFGRDPVEWTEAFIYEAAVVGVTVEGELPGSGLWVRAEVLRTLDGIMSMTHAVLREASGFDPPRVERTPYRVATAVTIGTLDLALPTQFAIGPVQPYVIAGLGAKRYDFDTDPFVGLQDQVVLPQPGVVGVANLGAGLTVRVLGATLDLQVKDGISEYWDRIQHDVVVLGGVTWPLF